MPKKIIQASNQKIRKKAQPVEKIDAGIKKIVAQMEQILKKKETALALAAPQINIAKRIVVVKEYQDKEKEIDIPRMVLINPEIIEQSSEKEVRDEGCLSLMKPEIRGQVARSKRVTLKATDLTGKEKEIAAEGLLARVFQHEIDHLDGKIFTDRAKPETLYQITKGDD